MPNALPVTQPTVPEHWKELKALMQVGKITQRLHISLIQHRTSERGVTALILAVNASALMSFTQITNRNAGSMMHYHGPTSNVELKMIDS